QSEQYQALIELKKADPAAIPTRAIIEASSLRNKDQLLEHLDQGGVPPEMQQQMQEMQAALEEAQGKLQEAEQRVQSSQGDMQIKQAELQIKAGELELDREKLEVDRYRAETERLRPPDPHHHQYPNNPLNGGFFNG